MNGLQIYTHATNTHANQLEGEKTAEDMLEEMREDSEGQEEGYAVALEKALLYYAGFDVLEVEEVYEEEG